MNNAGDYKNFDGGNLPLVSIVTPSFNQASFLERTIRSVLAQDYPRIEYIVIDAMSNDGTARVLQKYEQFITNIVREPDNGQSDAIDKGFKMASGDILTWINSDDCYCSSTVVSKAVAAFRDNPEYDLVYGRRKYIDENGHLVLVRPFRRFSYEDLKLSCYLPQECCFWSREIYSRAGGFIDQSYSFAMDYELWMRMLENGASFLAIKDFFGLYRLHENAKSVAQWETIGLKEIPRVYERYCEKVLSPGEMYDAYLNYHAGFNRFRNPRLERTRELLSSAIEKIQAASNGFGPLDNWTFRREVSLFDRRIKQASQMAPAR
jgi:Glycosyltransferases, probably involved in cell wall biogenesis